MYIGKLEKQAILRLGAVCNVDQACLCSRVGSAPDCGSRGHEFKPELSHTTFAKIDHEIISTAILSLPLIQEGQLSVTGKSMCALNTA